MIAHLAFPLAEKYDRFLGPLLFEPFALDIAARLRQQNYKSVLEIACGTGRLTRHLAEVLPPDVKLVATDKNTRMMQLACRLLSDKMIFWQTADAMDLLFPDQHFDLVACQFGLMFMSDKIKALKETHRVLKPGGKFIFNTWNERKHNGVIHLANSIIRRFLPGIPADAFNIPFSFSDPKELETLMTAAQFSHISLELVEKEGTSASAREAAIGMVEGNPIYYHIIERDPGLVAVIRNAVEKEIAGVYGERPLKSPLQAWVVEAEK